MIHLDKDTYPSIFDKIRDIYFRLRPEGGVQVVSSQAAELLGYDSADEIIALSPGELLMNPHDRLAALEAVTRDGFIADYSMILKKKDGSPFHVELTAQCRYDKDGSVAYIEGIWRDASERGAVEEAFRESEASLLNVLHAASYPCVLCDGRGVVLDVNEAACQLYGYTRDEMIGLTPRDVSLAPEETEQVIAGKHSRVPLRYHRRKNGEVFPIEAYVTHFDWRGTGLVLVSTWDISERVEAEKALRDSEAKYRTVFEATGNPYAVIDATNGRFIDVNAAGLEQYGYTLEEARQMTFLDVTADPEESLRGFQNKVTYVPLRYHKRKNGELFPVETFLSYAKLDGKDVLIVSLLDITKRVEAEQALKESESKYRSIFEATGVPYVLIDDETGKVIDANQAFIDQYGYTRDELHGMSYLDFSADPEKTREAFEQQITFVPLRYHKRKDGSLFPIEMSCTSLTHQGRKMRIAHVRDISLRVTAENSLRESEARYKGIVETQRDIILRFDSSLNFLFANESWERLTGTRIEDLKPGHGRPIYHPDDLEAIAEHNRKILLPPHRNYTEMRLNTLSGYRWFGFESYMITDQDGKPTEGMTVGRDIHDQKLSEEALRQSESKYRSTFESTGSPFFLMDTETSVILDANDAACKQYGYTRDELIGLRNVDVSAEPEETGRVHGERLTHVPHRLHKRKDGTIFPIEARISYYNWQGRAVALVSLQDITERVEAENALKESESKYRSLFEAAVNPLLLLDRNSGQLLDANQSAAELLGYSTEELPELAVQKISAEPEASHQDFAAGKTHIPVRYLRRKDGSTFPVEGRISYLQVGGREALLCSVQDITERLANEKALAESEARYRGIVESQRDIVLRYDLEGRPTYVNDSWNRVVGLPIDDPSIDVRSEAVHPEDREKLMEHIHALRQQPYRGYAEIRLKTTDGWRWYGFEAYMLRDQDGNPVEGQSVGRDIHDQKLAEEELAAYARRLSLATEAAREAVWEYTIDTRQMYMSPQAYAMVEYPLDGSVRFGQAIDPDDRARFYKHVEDHIAGLNDAVNYGFGVVTQSGKRRWIQSRGRIVERDENGRPLRVGGTITDITEAHTARQALEKAHEDLQKAYAAQKEFLNCMTHEVRTPLIGVKGYADMLLEGFAGPLTEEQRDCLRKIEMGSSSLLSGLSAMLEMSRIKSGGVNVAYQIFSPIRLAANVASSLIQRAHEKDLAMEVHDCGCSHVGVTDAAKLTLILNNLLTNAVKFTDEGRIDLYVESDDAGFSIAVVDTGKGMPDSELDLIFEEFQQLPTSAKYKETGFGMGLALVAALVDVLNAELTVTTVRGEGSAFTLRVPNLEPEAAEQFTAQGC